MHGAGARSFEVSFPDPILILVWEQDFSIFKFQKRAGSMKLTSRISNGARARASGWKYQRSGEAYSTSEWRYGRSISKLSQNLNNFSGHFRDKQSIAEAISKVERIATARGLDPDQLSSLIQFILGDSFASTYEQVQNQHNLRFQLSRTQLHSEILLHRYTDSVSVSSLPHTKPRCAPFRRPWSPWLYVPASPLTKTTSLQMDGPGLWPRRQQGSNRLPLRCHPPLYTVRQSSANCLSATVLHDVQERW